MIHYSFLTQRHPR